MHSSLCGLTSQNIYTKLWTILIIKFLDASGHDQSKLIATPFWFYFKWVALAFLLQGFLPEILSESQYLFFFGEKTTKKHGVLNSKTFIGY